QDDRLRVERDRARIEPGEVEELLDQPRHPLRLLPERVLELGAHRAVELAGAQGRKDPVHRGRRRPQLMRRDGDEVELQLVEAERLFVDTRTLDRQRSALGDEEQELLVVFGEQPLDERPDVEDADRRAVSGKERYAEQRLE